MMRIANNKYDMRYHVLHIGSFCHNAGVRDDGDLYCSKTLIVEKSTLD